MSEKCRHCPVAPGLPCRGLVARRLCQLVDPDHPDHIPGYEEVVRNAPMPAPAAAAEYPSLARQAANLAGSFWSWAVSGFSMATEEEQARRLAICQTCPQYDAAAIRCHLCGCYLAAKVAMRAEKCPINKW